MIHDVKIEKEGRFILNGAVAIYGIEIDGAKVSFSHDFEEELVTEKEAVEMCEAFIRKTFIEDKD
jgi:hypothetical protein